MPQLVPHSSSTGSAATKKPADFASSTTILRDFRLSDEKEDSNTSQLQQDLSALLQEPEEPAVHKTNRLQQYVFIGLCVVLAFFAVAIVVLSAFL